MRNNLILAGIILVYVVIGGISADLGLTEPLFEAAQGVPESPSDGGSWLEKLANALAPIAWAINAVAGIFQLATYQTADVPPLVNTLILVPLGTVLIFTGFNMARGR